jgi:Uma2 family endonuclease
MATKTQMDVEEYLHTSFDGADCEYVEGEVVERNTGQTLHGMIQAWITYLLLQRAAASGIQVITEIRIRITNQRYRIPDIAVWRAGEDLGTGIPNCSPLLAIEILSPDDRPLQMFSKVHDYFSAGIEWIWIIDPYERTAMVYSRVNPTGEQSSILRIEDPAIQIHLDEALNPPA